MLKKVYISLSMVEIMGLREIEMFLMSHRGPMVFVVCVLGSSYLIKPETLSYYNGYPSVYILLSFQLRLLLVTGLYMV